MAWSIQDGNHCTLSDTAETRNIVHPCRSQPQSGISLTGSLGTQECLAPLRQALRAPRLQEESSSQLCRCHSLQQRTRHSQVADSTSSLPGSGRFPSETLACFFGFSVVLEVMHIACSYSYFVTGCSLYGSRGAWKSPVMRPASSGRVQQCATSRAMP